MKFPADARVTMAYGGGGRKMRDLVNGLFLPAFGGGVPHDSAVLDVGGLRIAMTTDSYVVHPRFFPGGDIGCLAVFGTVNDLCMAGAVPTALSVGFVLEEGLAMDELARITTSIAEAAHSCGVSVVTGDTKVVERGKGDGLYVNTTGIGVVPEGVDIRPGRIVPGDVVLLSGDIGRHGIAVLSARSGFSFETTLQSDCAALLPLVGALHREGIDVHCLRDATRGGLAAVLYEFAVDGRVGLVIDEGAVPVCEAVQGACELLGLDPLHLACEGRMVAVVPAEQAARAQAALRAQPLGHGTVQIGRVVAEHPGTVVLQTVIGSRRMLDLPAGEPLPRIC